MNTKCFYIGLIWTLAIVAGGAVENISGPLAQAKVETAAAEDQETVIRRTVWEIATRSPDPSMPSPVEQLTEFQEKKGIKKDLLKTILLEYAEGKSLPKEFGSEVATFSLQVLVEWRCREVLAILVPRSTADINAKDETARNGRNNALSMIMRIGGKEALEVANNVLNDRRKYSAQNRFYIYDNLAKHLMNTNSVRDDKEFRADVTKLFQAKIEEEPDAASVEAMDKGLATESGEYRTSKRRENILKKHENTSLPYQRKYMQESLLKLKAEKETAGKKD